MAATYNTCGDADGEGSADRDPIFVYRDLGTNGWLVLSSKGASSRGRARILRVAGCAVCVHRRTRSCERLRQLASCFACLCLRQVPTQLSACVWIQHSGLQFKAETGAYMAMGAYVRVGAVITTQARRPGCELRIAIAHHV